MFDAVCMTYDREMFQMRLRSVNGSPLSTGAFSFLRLLTECPHRGGNSMVYRHPHTDLSNRCIWHYCLPGEKEQMIRGCDRKNQTALFGALTYNEKNLKSKLFCHAEIPCLAGWRTRSQGPVHPSRLRLGSRECYVPHGEGRLQRRGFIDRNNSGLLAGLGAAVAEIGNHCSWRHVQLRVSCSYKFFPHFLSIKDSSAESPKTILLKQEARVSIPIATHNKLATSISWERRASPDVYVPHRRHKRLWLQKCVATERVCCICFL